MKLLAVLLASACISFVFKIFESALLHIAAESAEFRIAIPVGRWGEDDRGTGHNRPRSSGGPPKLVGDFDAGEEFEPPKKRPTPELRCLSFDVDIADTRESAGCEPDHP